MRCLGGKHVVQQEVGQVEQTKDGRPAHVHGHQLAAHNISKVLDHTQTVELTCSHIQDCHSAVVHTSAKCQTCTYIPGSDAHQTQGEAYKPMQRCVLAQEDWLLSISALQRGDVVNLAPNVVRCSILVYGTIWHYLL